MKLCFRFSPFFQSRHVFFWALSAIFLVACAKHASRTASFGSGSDILAYGVYSAQTQDEQGMASKLSLNQNGTYSRKRFQGTCLLLESKGEWKSDHDALTFQMTEVRKRADCNTEDWQVDKVDKTSSRDIRNITTNSFELLDQEENVSAQWVRFVKR